MFFELAYETVLWLVLAAFVAGAIDSIAGGGGLITIPALLLSGVSPIEVLATNKLQGSFGSGAATLAYARAGQVRLKEQLGMALIAVIFSAIGAIMAHLVPAAVLQIIMPIVLLGIAAFFALRRGLSDSDSTRRMSNALYALTVVPLVSAYDGFFGPGTGSFFMLGFVALAGYGMLKATAHTKFLNFSSNLGSLLVFIASGHVLWMTGLAMALAQAAGASLGARLAMRVGVRLIRPLLIVTSTAMALRLIWQTLAG